LLREDSSPLREENENREGFPSPREKFASFGEGGERGKVFLYEEEV